jgi:hypothetical protein
VNEYSSLLIGAASGGVVFVATVVYMNFKHRRWLANEKKKTGEKNAAQEVQLAQR